MDTTTFATAQMQGRVKPTLVEALYSLARDAQTYLNLLYLFLAFPLGICYFVFVLVGITLSFAGVTIVILPTIPLALYLFWKMAAFERWKAMSWLHVDIAPMAAAPFPPDAGWIRRLQIHLARPVTWKSMLYLLLKFPFGILGFCLALIVPILILALGLTAFIIGFLAAPFVYLVRALGGRYPSGRACWRYLLHSLTGYGWVLSLFYVTNVLATVWGQFARAMLGINDQQLRLAEATARAERERARAELAEQKRRELIVNVSHELRTPVASIRGHIESLLIACDENEQATPDPQTLRKYLHIVHREAERLGTLVDDLLSVARAERSELRVTLGPVEAGEVVEEVYQSLMPLAKRERCITLIRKVTPGLPHVRADRQRLTQVLLNLVRNAITYTPDGGIVSINLRPADREHVALIVADTGIGIPPEDRERIFERFYRTDASRARTTGGTGLGLAIVRDFVIAMGGSINVNSRVGEGSTFTVLLRVS